MVALKCPTNAVRGTSSNADSIGDGCPPTLIPRSGPGVFVAARGTSRRTGSGSTMTYSVEVERNLSYRPAVVADFVEATLADRRGWSASTAFAFKRVADEADLSVLLATPQTADRLCAPLQTRGQVSCRNGALIVLNVKRGRSVSMTTRAPWSRIAGTWSTTKSAMPWAVRTDPVLRRGIGRRSCCSRPTGSTGAAAMRGREAVGGADRLSGRHRRATSARCASPMPGRARSPQVRVGQRYLRGCVRVWAWVGARECFSIRRAPIARTARPIASAPSSTTSWPVPRPPRARRMRCRLRQRAQCSGSAPEYPDAGSCRNPWTAWERPWLPSRTEWCP